MARVPAPPSRVRLTEPAHAPVPAGQLTTQSTTAPCCTPGDRTSLGGTVSRGAASAAAEAAGGAGGGGGGDWGITGSTNTASQSHAPAAEASSSRIVAVALGAVSPSRSENVSSGSTALSSMRGTSTAYTWPGATASSPLVAR